MIDRTAIMRTAWLIYRRDRNSPRLLPHVLHGMPAERLGRRQTYGRLCRRTGGHRAAARADRRPGFVADGAAHRRPEIPLGPLPHRRHGARDPR